MNSLNRPRISIAFFFLLVIVLYVYPLLHPDMMNFLLIRASYYGVLALVIGAVYFVVQYLQEIRFSAKSFLILYRFEITFACVMSLVVVVSVRPYFNYGTGETHLLALSRSLVFEKSVYSTYNHTPGTEVMDRLVGRFLDARPFLFAFLVGQFHMLIGYRPSNVFILNSIIMSLFLCVVTVATRRLTDRMTACAAVLFIIASPVFCLCARSGSNDLLNAFLFMLSMLILYQYMESPTPGRLRILWVSLLLLAGGREESFVYFLIVLGSLLVLGYIRKDFLRDDLTVLLWTPVWAAPVVWQRMSLRHPSLYGVNPGNPLFAWTYFKVNVVDLITNSLQVGSNLPYAGALHLLFWPIFSLLLYEIFWAKRTCQKSYQKHFFSILLICFAVYFVTVLSYFQGTYAPATHARWFLIYAILSSLSPVVFMAMPMARRGWMPAALLVFAAVAFIFYHPIAVEGYSLRSFLANRDSDIAFKVLEPIADERTLIIDPYPWRWYEFEWHAIYSHIANREKAYILKLLQDYAISNIFVIERYAYNSDIPQFSEKLDPEYHLETITIVQDSPTSYLKISRVKTTPPPS